MGKLVAEEIIQVSRMSGVSNSEQRNVQNGRYLVSIDEFVAALADLRDVHNSERWDDIAHAAFRRLDYDDTGTLLLGDLVTEFCEIDFEQEACSEALASEVSA